MDTKSAGFKLFCALGVGLFVYAIVFVIYVINNQKSVFEEVAKHSENFIQMNDASSTKSVSDTKDSAGFL